MGKSRIGILVVGAATAALLLFPLGSFGRPAAGNTWSGTWDTNFGVMTITQSGTTFSGTYSHDSGKVEGNISGNVATGTWSEAPTYAGPSDAGPFTWTMAPTGKSWSGTWTYAGSSSGGDWSGTCTGGACLTNPQVEEAEVTKWRFSVNVRNKIGSRTIGSGVVTATKRGAATNWRATGTAVHVDEYFTKEQDEKLTLRVLSGQIHRRSANLVVRVTSTSHPGTCPAGARGSLGFTTAQQGPNGVIYPAIMEFRVCGREHHHRYRGSLKYPAEVEIVRIRG